MKQTGKEKKEQRAKNKLALTKSWYKKSKIPEQITQNL